MTQGDNPIRITGKPDPHSPICHFQVDYELLPNRSIQCDRPGLARGSLLLEKLFSINGVTQVLVERTRVTVLKTEHRPWNDVAKEVALVIRESIASKKPLFSETILKEHTEDNDDDQTELLSEIQILLEQQINPSLLAHGGRVDLRGVDGTKVLIELSGGCQGCSLSVETVKNGIEEAILGAFPQMTEIVDLTNHAEGKNPFYSS